MKDIRITFYYADEGVYDYVKGTGEERETIVNWANLFYKKYNFKLDVLPIAFNEKLYKEKFCFEKSKGRKADVTNLAFNGLVREVISYLEIQAKLKDVELKAKDAELKAATTDAEKTRLTDEYIKISKEVTEMYKDITKHYDMMRYDDSMSGYEYYFRKRIFELEKNFKSTVNKLRLPVIFCRFQNQLKEVEDLTIAVQKDFKVKDIDDTFSAVLWAVLMVITGKTDFYSGPLILIDIAKIKRITQWALAHEIVHAVGNTTLDNMGSKDNIMNYDDARKYTTTPSKLNLEDSDKKKLESAFFVL